MSLTVDNAPTMTISDPSMISKWENLQNSEVFKLNFLTIYNITF